jgi:hypothetical protein
MTKPKSFVNTQKNLACGEIRLIKIVLKLSAFRFMKNTAWQYDGVARNRGPI